MGIVTEHDAGHRPHPVHTRDEQEHPLDDAENDEGTVLGDLRYEQQVDRPREQRRGGRHPEREHRVRGEEQATHHHEHHIESGENSDGDQVAGGESPRACISGGGSYHLSFRIR